jgi:hypothetical protein
VEIGKILEKKEKMLSSQMRKVAETTRRSNLRKLRGKALPQLLTTMLSVRASRMMPRQTARRTAYPTFQKLPTSMKMVKAFFPC